MYESIMWLEAARNLHPDDRNEFNHFLPKKKLTDYRDVDGKKFTYNRLNKDIVKKIKNVINKSDGNQDWDDFYKYLCAHSHVSSQHLMKYSIEERHEIIIAIPPFGHGIKDDSFKGHSPIVFLLVVLFREYIE